MPVPTPAVPGCAPPPPAPLPHPSPRGLSPRGRAWVLMPGALPSLQNVIPLGEGEVDAPQDPETQLQEQEKRIEISCALAAEASRRGRMLSGKARGDTEGRSLPAPWESGPRVVLRAEGEGGVR